MITPEQFETFNTEGYLVFQPGTIFSSEEVEAMSSVLRQTLPSWESGEILQNNLSHVDPRFELNHILPGNIKLTGCPLRHRFLRGHGSVEQELDDN